MLFTKNKDCQVEFANFYAKYFAIRFLICIFASAKQIS